MADFASLPQSQIQHSMTSMDQMMPKQPLIIIIWTHQEMMAWMSRKSIGILDVLMQDFGSKLGKLHADFASQPIANPTQHDLHGPDDAQTTIDYHHLDPSRDDAVDEQEIHWHFGCPDAGVWLGRVQNWADFASLPIAINQHSMTSMGQMMPKQPLIIIILTYQEMMAWMSRKSIGILNVLMQDFGLKLGKLG
jgi:hypothetical protein